MRTFTFTLVTLFVALLVVYAKSNGSKLFFKTTTSAAAHAAKADNANLEARSLAHATAAYNFAKQNGYNTNFFLIADFSIASGKNRLFVYNFITKKITTAGIVAHGSCNTSFLENAKFSNKPGCGCSSFGKYKIGYKYNGRFGSAYKLYGLDTSNSNAFERNIVLHSYYMVPDIETDPQPVCNSLGCIMVSDIFLGKLSKLVDASKKPVLLWVLN